MNEQGLWQVSPAYDLTFSSGPAGEHCTMLMGEGKNPSLLHLLNLAEKSNIAKSVALRIIDEVRNAVAKWHSFAKEAGVSHKSCSMIQTALKQVTQAVFVN